MMINYCFILIFCIIANVYTQTGVKFTNPLDSSSGWIFQGELRENSSTVDVIPELRALPVEGISKTMSICGYTVYHQNVHMLPFVVLVIDKRLGYTEIKLKSNMKRNYINSLYTFQVEAYDCDEKPHFSERKLVSVEIHQSQKPIFTKSSYHFTTKPNTVIGTQIGSVVAYERPGQSRSTSDSEGICKYEIRSESPVPFNVNKYGTITTKVLVLERVMSVRYRFMVQASDCSKPVPKTNLVPVTVDVFDDCKPHWTGIPSNVDFDGSKGVVSIVPKDVKKPILHVCTENCQNMFFVVNVTLHGVGIRPANRRLCKQDSASLIRQETLCGVSQKPRDMLKLAPLSLKNSDNNGYFFPGNVAVTVDPKYQRVLTRKFTVMFWMRHANMEVQGIKEQILCNTDNDVQNRHHFSLFLHNCKLILLLRKEFSKEKQNEYEPSEWRYGSLKEVCDDEWHHYAIMFDHGTLFVQIDGEMIKETPTQLNDRRLHESMSGQRDTTFTVAACYHAKTDKFVQHFKGHLASVKILDGELEAVNNVRCIATCGEALLLPHIIDVIGFQSSVTLFSEVVKIRSHDIYNLLKMFADLSYINTEISEELHKSHAANRTVLIEANIHCEDNKVSMATPRSITINLKSGKMINTISNTAHIRVLTASTISGLENERIALFQNLKFIKDNGTVKSLESCIIRPVGSPIQSWEHIDWPIDFVINHHLTALSNSHGLVLEGRQGFLVYETILGKMGYLTKKYSKRQFAISCSIIDRLVTEEITVTVNVKQRDLKTYYVVDDPDQNGQDSFQIIDHRGGSGRIGFQEKGSYNKATNKGSTSSTTLWIILPCLLVVLVAVVFGIVFYYKRVRARHNSVLTKLPTSDRDGNTEHVNMNVIYNSHSKEDLEVMKENIEDEDIPESDDMEEEEKLYYSEFDTVVNKNLITIPNFCRLPQGAHMRPVDV